MYTKKRILLAGVSAAALVMGFAFQTQAAPGADGVELTGTAADAGAQTGAGGTTPGAGVGGGNDASTNSHGGNQGGNGGAGSAGGEGGAGVLASGAGLSLTLTGTKTGGNGATGSAGGAGGNGTASAFTDTGGNGGSGGVGGDGGAGVRITGSGTVNIGDGALATTLAGGTAAAGGGGGAAGTSADGGAWTGSSGSAGGSGTSGVALDASSAGAGTIINIDTVTFNRGAAGAGTQTNNAIVANANTTLNFSGTNAVNGRLVSIGTVNLGTAAGTTVDGNITLTTATVRSTIGATQNGQFDNNNNGTATFTNAVLTPVVTGVGMANGERMILVTNSNGGPTVTGAAAVTETAAVAATTSTNTLVRTWSLGAGATSGFGGSDKYGTVIAANDAVLRIAVHGAETIASDLSDLQAAAFNAAANLTGNITNADRVALNHALHALNTVDGVRKAARQLAPDDGNTGRQSADIALQGLMGVISARTDAVRAQSAATGLSAGEVARGISVWVQGFGSTASQGRASLGYTMRTFGGALGADTPLSDTVRVGASLAYAGTDLDENGDRSGSGQDVTSYLGSLYGSYTGAPLHVDVTASAGRHSYKSTRLVDIPGFRGEARGSFSGTQFGVGTEVGYPIRVAAEGSMVLTPLASLSYTHLNIQGYTETGAGAANMTVGSRSINSLRGGLGAKLGATLAETSGWQINGSVRAAWLHEFQAQTQRTTASFAGAGGTVFTIEGQRPERNTLNLGVALDMVSDGNVTLTARYTGEFRTHYRSHGGTLQIRYDF